MVTPRSRHQNTKTATHKLHWAWDIVLIYHHPPKQSSVHHVKLINYIILLISFQPKRTKQNKDKTEINERRESPWSIGILLFFTNNNNNNNGYVHTLNIFLTNVTGNRSRREIRIGYASMVPFIPPHNNRDELEPPKISRPYYKLPRSV